jgi:hypothetical protein
MTVSMEAPRSGQAGFEISKTFTCFWRILYMLMSRPQNAGRNDDIQIADKYFEKCGNVKIFRYTAVMFQNYVHEVV